MTGRILKQFPRFVPEQSSPHPSLSRATEWEEIFASSSERNLIGFEQIRWEIKLSEPDLTRHTLWKKMKFWRNAPPCLVRSSKSPGMPLLYPPAESPSGSCFPRLSWSIQEAHHGLQTTQLCPVASPVCKCKYLGSPQTHTLKRELQCDSSTGRGLGNDSRTVSSDINGVSGSTKETPRVAWPSTTVERRHCLWAKIQANKQQEKDITKQGFAKHFILDLPTFITVRSMFYEYRMHQNVVLCYRNLNGLTG